MPQPLLGFVCGVEKQVSDFLDGMRFLVSRAELLDTGHLVESSVDPDFAAASGYYVLLKNAVWTDVAAWLKFEACSVRLGVLM